MKQYETEVVITDINIPFWRMVLIIIRWAAAAFVVSIMLTIPTFVVMVTLRYLLRPPWERLLHW